MEGFLKRNDASKALRIHYHTLEKLGKNDDIEVITIGNTKFYNIKKFLNNKGIVNIDPEPLKKNICYCRVSSKKQKEDLDRQITYMKTQFPCHELIYDISSGLNYNRRGLMKIINYATNGEINELVIVYKDRLVRFGYELIEYLIKEKSNGTIKILNNNEELIPSNLLHCSKFDVLYFYIT